MRATDEAVVIDAPPSPTEESIGRAGASAPRRGTNALRVLWMADDLEEAEGLAQVRTFAAAADPAMLEVDLLVLGRDSGQRASAGGAPLPFVPRYLGARGPLDLRGLLSLSRAMRSGRYDVVHTHSAWAGLWGGIAARRVGLPVVSTLYRHPSVRGEERVETWIDRKGLAAIQRSARRVVALSGSEWDRYVGERLFSRALLEVVHQGIDADLVKVRNPVDAQRLRHEAGFPPDSLIAVTAAALDGASLVDLLFWAIPDIVAAVPEMRFVIVGEGDAKHELHRRMRARGLNRYIHWCEGGKETERILAGGDLFIHPSLREPFPTILLKAMVAGLPAVATRVGAVPEVLGSVRVGRLVPATNPEALAVAIVELARDRDAFREMGRQARERVRERFGAKRWVEGLERIYRAVIAENRAGAPRRVWPQAGLSVELLALSRGAARLSA